MTLENNQRKIQSLISKFENDYKAKGRFRVLFSFGERVLETAFYFKAVKTVQESNLDLVSILLTPEENRTAEEQELYLAAVYLTMREDFKDAGEINYNDAAVLEALNFYASLGILTEARKNEIIATST